MIVAFILTAAFFSTVAAGKEPLSIKIGGYANHPKIFMDDNGRVSGFWPDLIEKISFWFSYAFQFFKITPIAPNFILTAGFVVNNRL